MLETNIRENVDTQKSINNSFNVSSLRDIEQGILNYMLLSKDNFIKITKQLTQDDFTFMLHKVIFNQLTILKDFFLEKNPLFEHGLDFKLDIFSSAIEIYQNIKVSTTLDILSQKPSLYIDSDLEIMNANAMEKEIALHSNKPQISGTIETKDSLTWFHFINDRLISINTTDITKLPLELHDNFEDTFYSISLVDLQKENNEMSMTFYGDPDNPDSIESFYLKKALPTLEWFDNICMWADKYDLDEDTFPRNRHLLQTLFELDISNKNIYDLPKEIEELRDLKILYVENNHIKEFPNELYKLRNLETLNFINNKIVHISEDIINLQKLTFFAACNNMIDFLPDNLFKLTTLIGICLHGNKLTVLPDSIGNLINLNYITISNNDIEELPQSISMLSELETLLPLPFLNLFT